MDGCVWRHETAQKSMFICTVSVYLANSLIGEYRCSNAVDTFTQDKLRKKANKRAGDDIRLKRRV